MIELISAHEKLHQYFYEAIQSDGDKIYLKSTSGDFSYRQIYETAQTFQKLLIREGIQENERVVIYASKNAASIAAMIACSLCKCTYVPVSSVNPGVRAKFIIHETSARFIFCDKNSQTVLANSGFPVRPVYSDEIIILNTTESDVTNHTSNDAGFILFTSGSTGLPKGVVISHQAARAFIDWSVKEFAISRNDIMASIAPFNFDLSVFDIYATAKAKATLVLHSEEETQNALMMAKNISEQHVTTIYATPTFYSTLANYGKMHKYQYPALKNVLFAGEVFFMENFKSLLVHWPDKKYANLYGPTETNVCTFYKVDPHNLNYDAFPIGKKCDYASLLLVDENGNEITERNKKGELLVGGQSLFNEYWNDETKTVHSIFKSNSNIRFYRTGDIVYKNENDDFVYVSRNDRMIKKNGYRIEPYEIEKVMVSYPNVSNVAVLFSRDKNLLLCILESSMNMDNTLVALKQYCHNFLPSYMIPDKFVFLDAMPKTSSGKIDLQALTNQYL